MPSNPAWLKKFETHWKKPRMGQQAKALMQGIEILLQSTPRPKHPLALAEQPFDTYLLTLSPLYRKSRELFLAQEGTFYPTLLTSPRSLSSPMLLENRIEYSPVEKELIWAATDPLERKNPAHLQTVTTYVTSLFHEQNHRVLWKFLPPPPAEPKALGRYLNFAESLVIMTDKALGDELGPKLAHFSYGCGITYDAGTDVLTRVFGGRKSRAQRREYRNYLQAILHSTYLNLEMYEPEDIVKATRALFPGLGRLADEAAARSATLDRAFIARTNLFWQKKHRERVLEVLGRKGENPLVLAEDPLQHHQQYLIAEAWMDQIGI